METTKPGACAPQLIETHTKVINRKTVKLFKAGIKSCLAAMVATGLFVSQTQATPYASCLANNAGTISFYLNEPGGNVTVTYEDGSTNASYNGVTTGLALPKGQQSFSLGSHTSYAISVTKVGTGVANTNAIKAYGTPRGIDVNKNPTSPYFGNVYACAASATAATNALWRLNSDLTGIATNSGGVAWLNSASEPYRIAVNEDDYLTVGSFASAHSGVWRINPTLTSNQLLLGPVGQTAGYAAGSQGDQFSRPLLIGNFQNGDACTLLTIDSGNIPSINASQLNSILVYSNISLSTIPRTNPPDLLGPETCLNLALNNNYPGITYNKNTGYIYVSNRRDGPTAGGVPTVQIYSVNNLVANTAGGPTNANGPGVNLSNPMAVGCVWDSFIDTGTQSDYFNQNGAGPADSAVSADGKYFCTLGYGNNEIRVISLTNGIPDVSTLYVITNKVSTTSAGRGICWDAADNIYVSSSGAGNFQEWTLGFTATAVTTGNAAGPTGFNLVLPSTQVSVYATNATQTVDANGNYLLSQANSYGKPTNASFVITRTGNVNSPLTVNFTLGGTAATNTYTTSAKTSVTLASGVSSTNITITAVNDSVARPTTKITLLLTGSSSYSTVSPGQASLTLLNVAPVQLIVAPLVASVYNALSNAYASFTITRWGDLNASAFTVNTFTYAGTAVAGTDYTLPGSITFNPGDLVYTNTISPLNNGQLPVNNATNPYVGNKTAIIGLGSGTGYSPATNTALLNILDSAYPTATVIYANPLTNATDDSNWTITSANNNMATNTIDSTVQFGYDLVGDPSSVGPIGLPPSGATSALRLTVNKSSSQGNGAAAGVNLYPKNLSLSGNYAVRFSMNIVEGDQPSYTTEGAMFGINHAAVYTNWWSGSGVLSGWDAAGTNTAWTSDGIWYWVGSDNGAAQGEYEEFTGTGGHLPNTGWSLLAANTPLPFTGVFPAGVFTTSGGAGIPANESVLYGYTANNWADVEIKQVNNLVTLSINKTKIFVYTNTTAFTSGTPMLGYSDPFSSVGGKDGSAYFSNLRVVPVGAPYISQVALNNVNHTAVINFTTTDGDNTVASFAVQGSGGLSGFADVPATITQLGAGAFQAVVPQGGAVEFYRIRLTGN